MKERFDWKLYKKIAFEYLHVDPNLDTYLIPTTLLPLSHPTHYLVAYAHSEEEAYDLAIEYCSRRYMAPQSFLVSPYQCFKGILEINCRLFRMKDEIEIISEALEESHLAREYPEME